MKKCFLIIFLLVSFFASAQSWVWGRDGSTGSYARGAAIDSKNNLYSTGFFSDSIGFGNTMLVGPFQSEDIYLVKYDSNGSLIWAREGISKTKGYTPMESQNLACDLGNNAYVVGGFTDSVAFDSIVLRTSHFPGAGFVAKYNSNGNVLWAKQLELNPLAITADKANNIYVTGSFNQNVYLQKDTLFGSSGSYEVFLVKFDSSGNELWAKQSLFKPYSSACLGIAYAIALDDSDNIFIGGAYSDNIAFGSCTLKSSLPSNTEAFVVKYDQNGVPKWAATSSSSKPNSVAQVNTIVTDIAGRVYAGGGFDYIISFGSIPLNNYPLGNGQVFLTKFDKHGNPEWCKQSYNRGTGWTGHSLVRDMYSNIYFSGGALNEDSLFLSNDTLHTRKVNNSLFLTELDTNGRVECKSIIATGGGGDLSYLACPPSGMYVYMTGDLVDTSIFNKDTLWGNGVAFIARWEPCDIKNDTNKINNPPVNECGGVFVPDAFSPNKDGHNDILYVRGDCIKALDFVVFDRWGNKVFETNSQSIGWDGMYLNKPMNTGNFVYYVKAQLFDGTTVEKKGSVALIR